METLPFPLYVSDESIVEMFRPLPVTNHQTKNGPRYARGPGHVPGENCGASDDRSVPDDETIDEQQNDRPDDRADPPCRRVLSPQQRRGQEAADERAGDAEQNRDDPAAGVASRHQELRNRADDQTKQNPSDDVHFALSSRSVGREAEHLLMSIARARGRTPCTAFVWSARVKRIGILTG